ncbi:fimbrial protein [Variovorax dokdonensis]|uniref:Fimbrial protein n=1 Tax=Variovorax dokdonensis TaxID=344883 RepID=A0ABT7NCV5_9BURK|nr:fimbrial protein [Variovorax dokdonensis]MDM0045758.1 fimbrial protein [Variovorax dokdonensis]
MTNRSKPVASLWALFMLMVAPAAHAGFNNCTTPELPLVASAAGNVPSSLANGAVINGSTTAMTLNINCAASWTNGEGNSCYNAPNWAMAALTGSLTTTAFPNVYRHSDMPSGLAYQILDASGQPMPLDSGNRINSGVRIQKGLQPVAMRVRFIKLDNTLKASSYVLAMHVSCTGNEYANQGTADASSIKITINIKAITQTCVMDNPNMQVTLPEVAAYEFSGIGSAKGYASVPLSFRCDPNVDARINFSDATSPINGSTVLALDAGSTATGVGVQMVYSGSPIKMSPNEDFNYGGTDLSLKNLDNFGSTVIFPISAQYVQAAGTVTPGSVKARALVNIAYN